MSTRTLFQEYEELQRRALERQELLDKLAAQERDLIADRMKLEADVRSSQAQEIAVAQKFADEVNKLSGFKFRLVRKTSEVDDGYDTTDEMEKEWKFNHIVEFLGRHQCVFVTNTVNEGKKLVFALFPFDDIVTYLASDIILSYAMISITKLVRATPRGEFDIMMIIDDLKISVPQGNPKYKTLTSSYCGSVMPTQNCARGCEFCKTLFKYDKRRSLFGNHEPSGDDDEVPTKKRTKHSSSSD